MTGPMNPNANKKVPTSYKDDTSSVGIANNAGVYIGIVKKNDDPQNMGRLEVWIEDFGGDPEDQASWIAVSYASPFAGTTSIYDQGSNVKDYEDTIKSYGFWAVPPDRDAFVLVAFASGRLDRGYWFACTFQRGTQVSIPGIPAKNTWTGENKPAAPKNKNDKDADITKYVEHKPMSNALKQQGLQNDNIRGTTSSGATREAPSKVLGILTPGQHQFVMDDGDKNGDNKLIRLRTTNGTQLLLDDTAGHVYLITKTGETWMELSADGRVHLYGAGDISIRSEQNINLRADYEINIEAGESINMKAGTGNISLEAQQDVRTKAGGDTNITSGSSSNISSAVAHYETAGAIHMNGPAAANVDSLPTNTLTTNQGVNTSICSTVPEHEPWAGHSGSKNPIGPGNQQMQGDPNPSTQPRQASPTDSSAPLASVDPKPGNLDVPLSEVSASTTVIDKIKEKNGYSPVNVNDGSGISAGFGSPIASSRPPIPLDPATEALNKATAASIKAALDKIPVRADNPTSLLQSVQAATNSAMNTVSNAGTSLLNSIGASVGFGSLGGMTSRVPAVVSNQILAQGASPQISNQLLAADISKSETAVKGTLAAQGVKNIPQNVFDGLVSFHNQVDNINYVYIKGEKIDLTKAYKASDWPLVASYIAADERDRPRRIQEAAMITYNDYGKIKTEQDIIDAGIKKAKEAIAKNRLNQQTGDPATAQQVVATATNYFAQTGNTLPGLNFRTNLAISTNITNATTTASPDSVTERLSKLAGPWPY